MGSFLVCWIILPVFWSEHFVAVAFIDMHQSLTQASSVTHASFITYSCLISLLLIPYESLTQPSSET